jgi:hypothetical protein
MIEYAEWFLLRAVLYLTLLGCVFAPARTDAAGGVIRVCAAVVLVGLACSTRRPPGQVARRKVPPASD